MNRFLYSEKVANYIGQTSDLILGQMTREYGFSLEDTQKYAWISQIEILKRELKPFSIGQIIFEYTIPRMGKRVDNVFLYNGLVFLLEFKVGDNVFQKYAIEQVLDYALDLKNFHKESHKRIIVPILIATEAPCFENKISIYPDGIIHPLLCRSSNIGKTINSVCHYYRDTQIDPSLWSTSVYMPTPTIIEAAQALYRGHSVNEISRSDSGAINLGATTQAINNIIDFSKKQNKKSICFLTGVPGAGKTLAGLNIANERHRFDENEHAIFLSGNGPLVDVLQESLARNDFENSDKQILKGESLRKAKTFIQNIHQFRDQYISSYEIPFEKVAIFDEAQRAWTVEQTSKFMQTKRGKSDFNMSEPEFLISVMDRHKDWAVIICLIGGGQEINVGEAGMPEWFQALKRKFSNWNVFVSPLISDHEYTRGLSVQEMLRGLKCNQVQQLHLSVSLRSFRSEKVSDFVKALLDANLKRASRLLADLRNSYPVVMTRDINKAKEWVKSNARGSERFGIIASSGASRLKPYGIWVQSKVDASTWFLNKNNDVRSSNFLEDTATEFDIQGLELDWALVSWDANFRFVDGNFKYFNFSGSKWQNINKSDKALYLKNAYRVILTRARQGMVIFIPEGDNADITRNSTFYDGTFNYLREIGIRIV